MTIRIDGLSGPLTSSLPPLEAKKRREETLSLEVAISHLDRMQLTKRLTLKQKFPHSALYIIEEEEVDEDLLVLLEERQFDPVEEDKFILLATAVLREAQSEYRNQLEILKEKEIFFFELEEKISAIRHFLTPIFQDYLQERERREPLNEREIPMGFSRGTQTILKGSCRDLDDFLKREGAQGHQLDDFLKREGAQGHQLDDFLKKKGTQGHQKEESFTFYEAMCWGIRDRIPLDLQFDFIEIKLKLREINHWIYLEQVKEILERNKEEILKTLFPDLALTDSSDAFILLPVASETHNRGKIPCLVHHLLGGQQLSFYYKPRSAEMDIAILKLFKKLNRLSRGNPHKDLSVYKILTLPEGGGSVWEFIEGDPPCDPKTNGPLCLQQAIKIESDQIKKQRMERHLEYLESVCKRAGIVDLHSENLLINQEGKITLIDLECLSSPGSATSLYQTAPPPPCLTEEELGVIDSFRLKATSLCNRIVPITTARWINRMLHLGNIQEFSLIPERFFSDLTQQGYRFLNKNLCRSLLREFAHSDIPYFLKLGDKIYLGEVKSENWVAMQD